MSKIAVLVEAIGGPKVVAEVDAGASISELASAAAAATERSLNKDDGTEHPWKLFTPTAAGGFAPAKRDLDLSPIVEKMRAVQAAGDDAGFAGPGEHEGSAYVFRVRLFVPKPLPPRPAEEKPPPIEDEEAIDLTNLDEGLDELETVRTNADKARRTARKIKSVGRKGDGPRKKRRRKRPQASRPGADAADQVKTDRLEPSAADEPAPSEPKPPAEAAPPPKTPPKPAKAPEPDPEPAKAPPRPSLGAASGNAHTAVVATPALAARTPVPGDAPITGRLPPREAPSVSEPAPAPEAPAVTRVIQRHDFSGKSAPGTDSGADDTPKKARSTGIPKKARSTGIPKKSRSTGIPKKARSTGIPKKSRSTGIPKKSRSTGIPKKSRSTGIPKKSRSTGLPKKAGASRAGATMSGGRGGKPEKSGGGFMGLLIALVILAGVTVALVMVLAGGDDEPTGEAAPAPEAAPTARLSDRLFIQPFAHAEWTNDDDLVRTAISGFNGLGVRTPADLDDSGTFEAVQASAEELATACAASTRFDACVAGSHAAFAAYLGSVRAGAEATESGLWFVRSADLGGKALSNLMSLPDEARGEALKRLAVHSVKLGGQSKRVLSAKAPKLAELATKTCAAGAVSSTPDCQDLTSP